MYLSSESSGALGAGLAGQHLPKRRHFLLRQVLKYIESGRLTIVLPNGERVMRLSEKPGPDATWVLHNYGALRRVLAGGDIGFAEGFIAGDWSSPNLVALIALFAENVSAIQQTMDGFWPIRAFNRVAHLLRGNSQRGSKRNIAFHYDLGNDFYRLWLDPSMTYSSACAVLPGQSLEQAQRAKLAKITELLALAGDEKVLEIGCGWGALASHLADHCDHVTGVTLSAEQLAHAETQTAKNDKVELRLQDYRAVDETFDRIVSIEMLEAVGESYWPTYFAKLRACLKPGGSAVLQVITMREDRFEPYRIRADFIQRYVFPGGMLPTEAIVAAQAADAGLEITSTETFGLGYAATLAAWRLRFLGAADAVEKLGFDAKFRRMWEYYLCYCEAGFRSGTIDVGLYVLKG